MDQQSQLSQDLRYVRELVDPAARPHLPRAVMLTWAAIVLVGFPLPDLVSQAIIWRYWMVAGPIGFLLCALFSARVMRQLGQHDGREMRRQLAHWGVLALMGGLALLLPGTGYVEWQAIAPLALLLVAFAYLLAGVHLDRSFAAPGAIFALGYCLLIFRVAFAWTIVGVLAALAFVLMAEKGRRHRVVHAG